MAEEADGNHASGSKVFVGGLDITVSSDDLAQHFAPFGTILDAVAMKHRGFGFVEWAEAGAAEAAIAAGPHALHGKETSVKLAETREQMAQTKLDAALPGVGSFGGGGYSGGSAGSGPPSLPNKIFVGGLPRHIDTAYLERYFSNYGALTDAVVMPSRGFGFVAFHEEEAMQRAMGDADKHAIDGAPITVKVADGNRPPPRPAMRPPFNGGSPFFNATMPAMSKGCGGSACFPFAGKGACCMGGPCSGKGCGGGPTWTTGIKKIFVGGIPKDLPTPQLDAYFSWYGRLTDCVVMAGRGFGFVEFADQASVDRVMMEQGNHMIGGQQVSLRLADGKRGGGLGGLGGGGRFGGGCCGCMSPIGGGCCNPGAWGPPSGGVPPAHVRWGPPPGSQAAAAAWAQPGLGCGQAFSGKGGGWGPRPIGPMGCGGCGPMMGGGGGEVAGKIFVRGLPDSMADEDLSSYFSCYGSIVDCKVMAGRGFGFVTFANPQSADAALRGKNEIEGARLSVKMADGLKGPKMSSPY